MPNGRVDCSTQGLRPLVRQNISKPDVQKELLRRRQIDIYHQNWKQIGACNLLRLAHEHHRLSLTRS
jgi:hypothetical protein